MDNLKNLNIDYDSKKLKELKITIQADEEIRTLDPLLGKEMLYH